MADDFELRAYCHLDRMQPQYAAFVGTVTQGDLPIEGMAALYVEMAPGNHVFRVVDVAVKATMARPGAQIVERQFGMFELHSESQADVLQAGEATLRELDLEVTARKRPTRKARCITPSRARRAKIVFASTSGRRRKTATRLQFRPVSTAPISSSRSGSSSLANRGPSSTAVARAASSSSAPAAPRFAASP